MVVETKWGKTKCLVHCLTQERAVPSASHDSCCCHYYHDDHVDLTHSPAGNERAPRRCPRCRRRWRVWGWGVRVPERTFTNTLSGTVTDIPLLLWEMWPQGTLKS